MKLKGLACGLSLGLALAQGAARADELVPVGGGKGRPNVMPSYVAPCPTPSTSPSTSTTPSPSPDGNGNSAAQQSIAQAQSAPEMSGAGEGSSIAAPNMIGNLLGLNRSVLYPIFRVDPQQGRLTGISFVNPKVAENNSPLPQDRIGYRYNYFSNSNSVSGVTGSSTDPSGIFGASRDYDVHMHTFQFEKTFLDGMMSAELRVPFSTTLSNNLNIRATRQNGFAPTTLPGEEGIGRRAIGFRFTPQDTLGNESTQFGDVSLILKALLYCNDGLFFTGGVAIGAPTAPDTQVNVTDSYFFGPIGGINRFRNFTIKNETWSMGPFLAFLSTPSDRFFTQGFAQVDFPLNSTSYRFVEDEGPKHPGVDIPLLVGNFNTTTQGPFVQTGKIRDQMLLNLDLGTGYWFVKNQCCDAWLNGLAGILEMHYTTTLDDAQVVVFPRDNVQSSRAGVNPNNQIGSQRGRVDILDVTGGVSALIANRLLLTTGVSFPLLQGDNRTYDWEAHIQANYYFGGPRYRESFAPPF